MGKVKEAYYEQLQEKEQCIIDPRDDAYLDYQRIELEDMGAGFKTY